MIDREPTTRRDTIPILNGTKWRARLKGGEAIDMGALGGGWGKLTSVKPALLCSLIEFFGWVGDLIEMLTPLIVSYLKESKSKKGTINCVSITTKSGAERNDRTESSGVRRVPLRWWGCAKLCPTCRS